MIDREKVIKGLEHCKRESEGVDNNPCEGCPYITIPNGESCASALKADAIALLKEQPIIRIVKSTDIEVACVVRCEHCKYGSPYEYEENLIRCRRGGLHDNDWFCADGEHK